MTILLHVCFLSLLSMDFPHSHTVFLFTFLSPSSLFLTCLQFLIGFLLHFSYIFHLPAAILFPFSFRFAAVRHNASLGVYSFYGVSELGSTIFFVWWNVSTCRVRVGTCHFVSLYTICCFWWSPTQISLIFEWVLGSGGGGTLSDCPRISVICTA